MLKDVVSSWIDSQWLDLRLGLVRGPVLTTPIVTGGDTVVGEMFQNWQC